MSTLDAYDITTNYHYVLTYDGTYFLLEKPSNDVSSFNIQYYVPSTDFIIVPQNTQYWVYGDLEIDGGTIENYGHVIITNGNLNYGSVSGGTFSNYNSLTLNTFAEIDGLGQVNYIPRWRANYMLSSTSSLYDDGESVTLAGTTFSINSNIVIPNGATSGAVLTSDSNGVANWSNTRYTATQSFLPGITQSFTHNLNTPAIMFNLWDEDSGQLISTGFETSTDVIKQDNNTLLVCSQLYTYPNARVVIIS